MRRNILIRTKDLLADWILGVEEDDDGPRPSKISSTTAKSKPKNPRRPRRRSSNSIGCDEGDSESFGTYSMLGAEPDWAVACNLACNQFDVGSHCSVVFAGNVKAAFLQTALFASTLDDSNSYFHIAVRKYEMPSTYENGFHATIMVDDCIKEQFLEWQQQYKRFNPGDKMLPLVVDGEQISGTSIAFKGQLTNNKCPDDDMFEEINWILNNTHGVVRCTETCWIFEDAQDALMFKLVNK
jgi:hypothetical protein